MDVRYRIDGVLRRVSHHERHEASAIVKRLKVMANMDIAQERVCQGGRISLKVGGGEFDLRVSIVPVPVGESVVMRILKKGAFTLTLGDLGFSEEKENKFRRILSQPHGMILVCGPTGSGKSTTLYASLKEIQRPDRKLLTAEDPIEYQMPGIIQVQMNTAPKEEEKRVTFSRTLREFLRQDPDVILVGEIRDLETTSIAISAAETGHMVYATLHTNSAATTVDRVIDIFPPHQQAQIRMQLSVTLEGVMCQTLIPKAKGGGRVMAMELMPVIPAVRNIIREGKSHQIPNAIMSGAQYGMQSMDMALRNLYQQGLITYEDACAKATSIEEFNRLIAG